MAGLSLLQRNRFRCALLFLVFAPSVHADDYYVDAVFGSNTNSGVTASEAWLTITHALAQVPAPPAGENHRILVAPGTYDAALGEEFALRLRPHIQLIGTGGSDVTWLIGGGQSIFLNFVSGLEPELETLVQGFSLRDGNWGCFFFAHDFGTLAITLRDLDVREMFGGGIAAHVDMGDTDGESNAHLLLENVRVVRCELGLVATNGGTHNANSVTATDCVFSRCRGWGVSHKNGPPTNMDELLLNRCRVEENGFGGIRLLGCDEFACFLDVRINDCLVARNRGDGVAALEWTGATLRRCTIVGNEGAGIRSEQVPFVEMLSCIVTGNGIDVFPPGQITATYSNVGDGSALPGDGFLSADPLFVNAAQGDYRLGFGSPCVDAGDPSAPIGTVDLAGTPRPVDGDLDTLPRADMGALELATLVGPDEVAIGGVLQVELWGPVGGTTVLFGARSSLLDTPENTPFGALYLDSTLMRMITGYPVAPGPPSVFTLPFPNLPEWIGLEVGLQARTASSAAPQGEAWSNPVAFVLTP